MPKRPNSLETLQIALELLRRIPKGRTVTAPQLKQLLADSGFERNIRTIERQLETLTLSGYFGIERDETSKPYRYCWNVHAKGMSLPTLFWPTLIMLSAEQVHL
jgi:hypothetical protein